MIFLVSGGAGGLWRTGAGGSWNRVRLNKKRPPRESVRQYVSTGVIRHVPIPRLGWDSKHQSGGNGSKLRILVTDFAKGFVLNFDGVMLTRG